MTVMTVSAITSKLKMLLVGSVVSVGFAAVAAPAATAIDLFDGCSADSSSAVCKAAGNDSAQNIVASIISALLWIIGAIAVIMIVIAGIKYTTSNGDANKIQSAKNTLLYAVIGVVVAVLGQAIIIFVVDRIT